MEAEEFGEGEGEEDGGADGKGNPPRVVQALHECLALGGEEAGVRASHISTLLGSVAMCSEI